MLNFNSSSTKPPSKLGMDNYPTFYDHIIIYPCLKIHNGYLFQWKKALVVLNSELNIKHTHR